MSVEYHEHHDEHSCDKNIQPSKLLLALNHHHGRKTPGSSSSSSSTSSNSGLSSSSTDRSSSFSPPTRIHDPTTTTTPPNHHHHRQRIPPNDLNKNNNLTPPFSETESSPSSSVYQPAGSSKFIANVNSINVVLDQTSSGPLGPDEYNNNWNIQHAYEDGPGENELGSERDELGKETAKTVENVRKETLGAAEKPPVPTTSSHHIPAVVRERMHSELAKRISSQKMNNNDANKKAQLSSVASTSSENLSSSSSSAKSLFTIKTYSSHVNITDKSSRDEVKEFLLAKEFSNKLVFIGSFYKWSFFLFSLN